MQGELDVFYPLVESSLPGGAELAARARGEHATLEAELAGLEAFKGREHAVSASLATRLADDPNTVMECPFIAAMSRLRQVTLPSKMHTWRAFPSRFHVLLKQVYV